MNGGHNKTNPNQIEVIPSSVPCDVMHQMTNQRQDWTTLFVSMLQLHKTVETKSHRDCLQSPASIIRATTDYIEACVHNEANFQKNFETATANQALDSDMEFKPNYSVNSTNHQHSIGILSPFAEQMFHSATNFGFIALNTNASAANFKDDACEFSIEWDISTDLTDVELEDDDI